MRKGSNHSPESILKISLSKKGHISPNKGKVFTLEWRENLRKAHIGYKINDNQKLALKNGREIARKLFSVGGLSKDPKYRNRQKVLNSYRRKEAGRLYGKPHSNKEWEDLKVKYNFICPSCHKIEPEIKLTRDHIISLSKGGSDSIENIQPLCKSCNCKKHTKSIRY